MVSPSLLSRVKKREYLTTDGIAAADLVVFVPVAPLATERQVLLTV
jgi:hypothetical protein